MGHLSRHQILGPRSPSRLIRLRRPSRTVLLPSPIFTDDKAKISRLSGEQGQLRIQAFWPQGPSISCSLKGWWSLSRPPTSFQLCSAGDRTVKLLALRAMTMLFSFRFGSFKINTIHRTRNAGWIPSKLTGVEEGAPRHSPLAGHVAFTWWQPSSGLDFEF